MPPTQVLLSSDPPPHPAPLSACAMLAMAPPQVLLSRLKFEELSNDLFRRCRLPLDSACWQAGIDLDKAVGEWDARKQELRARGVPAWKLEVVSGSSRGRGRGRGVPAWRLPLVLVRWASRAAGALTWVCGEVVSSCDSKAGAGRGRDGGYLCPCPCCCYCHPASRLAWKQEVV